MAVIDSTNNPILPKQNYDRGPFKGSNGAFYVILLTNNELAGACFKANDPTVTGDWSVQDQFHRPRDDEETILSAAARLSPDRKRIGVVTTQSNGSVHWSEFIIEDSGPPAINDMWKNLELDPEKPFDVTKNVNGGGVLPDASVHACDCVWRLDGRRVVVYQGFREMIGSTEYDRINLAHSSDGATWTDNSIQVDPNDAVHYRACRLALDGSDNTTILFRGSDDRLYQRVFKKIDNELQLDVQDTGGTVTSAATFAIGPCVWIDRTGTNPDRWKAVYADAQNDLRQIVYDSGANPTSFDTSLEVSDQTPGPGGISVHDGTVYGLVVRAADKDVYKTDDGGVDTSWSTLTSVLIATVTEISTNIYTRGTDTVHAAVYNDPDPCTGKVTAKYNELVL